LVLLDLRVFRGYLISSKEEILMNKNLNRFNCILNLAVVACAIEASAFAAGCASKANPALLNNGQKLYAVNCVACHGEKGDGNGTAGAMLNPKPRNFVVDKFKKGDKAEQVYKTLAEGLPGTAMAAYGYLPEADRCALAHYVLAFRKN
jgi:mono/diheme cytochrome c family protein